MSSVRGDAIQLKEKDFILRPFDLMVTNQIPIGMANRDIEEGETIEIKIGTKGTMFSEAIDFSMLNDIIMEVARKNRHE